MKNADMPAMPQTWVPDYGNKPPVQASGLTKREEFAKAAMQGLLSGYYRGTAKYNLCELPEEALKIAEALLAELEK